MTKAGNFDYHEFEDFAAQFAKATAAIDGICQKCARQLAARLLALVIPKTPVGQYPAGSGKAGGTLRRGWTSKTHEDAAGGGEDGTRVAEYVDSLGITRVGDTYVIEVVNPVEYASYVEYGHRTVNGGWVEGRFMLTISEERLKQIAPKALEKMIVKEMEKHFGSDKN